MNNSPPPDSCCGICILCCCRQLVTPVRDETASIPDVCLPVVHEYSGMSPQLFPQLNCALRGCDHEQIVEETKSRSLPSNLSEIAVKTACCPRLNNMGMRGSLCSPPSPCRMWWTPPRSSSHKKVDGPLQNILTKGKMRLPPSMNPCNIALCQREWSIRQWWMRANAQIC